MFFKSAVVKSAARTWRECVAVCCSVLRRLPQPEYYNIEHKCSNSVLFQSSSPHDAMCCRVLPCVAVCCRVLRCVAVCCRVLPCVAVCWRVLPCVARVCSVLQCVAPWAQILQFGPFPILFLLVADRKRSVGVAVMVQHCTCVWYDSFMFVTWLILTREICFTYICINIFYIFAMNV